MHDESENLFESFDGTELFYRSWEPQGLATDSPRKAIVLFHRGHEHSGRLSHLVSELNLPEFSIFAWDQRGHGKSPGVRGYAESAMDFVRDIESFIRHLAAVHRIAAEDIVVVSHSVSAVLVTTWLKNYAPRIRGVVLVTPAFQVKLYLPFALTATRLGSYLFKKFANQTLFIKSYVTGSVLTHEKEFADSYDSDPLVSKQIAANILVDLFDLSKQVINDAGAICTPTLLLSARADWVVKNLPQRRFFRRLSSSYKKVRVFRGMYHALLHEKDRQPIVGEVRAFVDDVFKRPVDFSGLITADKQGYTSEEYAWINAGLPMLSWRRLGFEVQKIMMRNIGSLSDGVRLGWETGFDSGQSLDYVYRNIASGKLGIGQVMDKFYLESVGWVGIRRRKQNIELLLKDAIARISKPKVESSKSEVLRIVDIAGGPGRYLLDVVKQMPKGSYRLLVRDWSEGGLAEGREIARSLGLDGVEYKRADAFSPESLAEIGQVDLAIVSGLYELFPDNEMILRSLRGVCQNIAQGGYLIYTNQPWHPQLEMIAEVLINRDKLPWVMRRRTQAEMDELVRSVGLTKLRMELDNAQIFTVSLAQKL